MSAACTTAPSSSPCVSTAMWRLRPFTFLAAASQPRGPPLSVVFTLRVSMTAAAVGLGSRPVPSRSMSARWWRMLSHTPARGQEQAEVAVDGRPRQERRRRWQVPPLAAGAQEVEQAVRQPAHVGRPRTASGLGGRDQRLQQAELVGHRSGLGRARTPRPKRDSRASTWRPPGRETPWNVARIDPVSPSRRPRHPPKTGTEYAAVAAELVRRCAETAPFAVRVAGLR
jgi:hypothetical protein